MQFFLASVSKDPSINRPLLDQLANVFELQLYTHVAPFWQGGGARVLAVSSLDSMPDTGDVCPVIVFDDPDQPGALGYHTYDPKDREYAKVFWQPIKENGGTLIQGADSLSVTGSHEIVESYVDPYVNDFSFVDAHTAEWKEACDRTEGDSYEHVGVALSNFLGPRAFRDGDGPYDWMRLLQSPWEVRPGGYVQRMDIRTGKISTTWGPKMPAWKRELKELKTKMKLSRAARRLEKNEALRKEA